MDFHSLLSNSTEIDFKNATFFISQIVFIGLCFYWYIKYKEKKLYQYINKNDYKKKYIKSFIYGLMLFLFEFFYLSLKYYKVIVLLEFILLFTIVIRAMCVKIELASYTNKDDS